MMHDQYPSTQEQAQPSPEAAEQAVQALASAYHEDWRQTRLGEDGSYEPRVKKTGDEAWSAAHGIDEVDIANSTYAELPADWQAENKAAAEVIVGALGETNGAVDLSDEAQRDRVGGIVHDAWLSRNDWAKGGELDVPFASLPTDEQAKDIRQVEIAQELFK